MLDKLLPRHLSNEYRANKLALWLFGLVVGMKAAQSLAIIFSGYSTAQGADGIPLDTYSPAASQALVAIFAQGSLWRLFFCLLCVLVLLRYRNAVPLMFVRRRMMMAETIKVGHALVVEEVVKEFSTVGTDNALERTIGFR